MSEATQEARKKNDDEGEGLDRKSTRLNSSHLVISYAVFCLKKKKTLNMSRSTAAYKLARKPRPFAEEPPPSRANRGMVHNPTGLQHRTRPSRDSALAATVGH